MKYQANDNLEVMKFAKNYNNFLINFVSKIILKNNHKNICDFGCSDGFFIEKILAKNIKANFYGVENDDTSFEICKNKKIEIKKNLEEYSFNFDLIYSFNVLEHIENDIEMLKKMYDKLNDNGHLILYVPALNFLYSSMDKKTGHFRRYEKANLKNKLNSAGFKIELVEFCDVIGILATLCYILKDKIKNNQGNINKIQIKIYDLIFPFSRLLDKLFFKKYLGKNLIVIAKK